MQKFMIREVFFLLEFWIQVCIINRHETTILNLFDIQDRNIILGTFVGLAIISRFKISLRRRLLEGTFAGVLLLIDELFPIVRNESTFMLSICPTWLEINAWAVELSLLCWHFNYLFYVYLFHRIITYFLSFFIQIPS